MVKKKKKNLTLINSGFPPTLLSLEFPSSFKDKHNIKERDLGPDAHVSSSVHPGLSCCMHSMPTGKSVHADHAWTLDPHCPDHRSFWASWFSLFVLTSQPPNKDCAVPCSVRRVTGMQSGATSSSQAKTPHRATLICSFIPCPRMSPRLLWSWTFQHNPSHSKSTAQKKEVALRAPLRTPQWLLMLNFLPNSPWTRKF